MLLYEPLLHAMMSHSCMLLTTLYYLAIDCGFLASLTDDDQWRSTLGMYHETLLGYLQSNRFQCYLSGLYFWENFRAQTIPLLVTCVSRQAIPLFHYCSDCVNQGTCSHICCKLWLETACRNAGLQSLQPVQPYSEGTLHNSLMILADVATKELQMRQDANIEVKMPEHRTKLVGKHKIEVTQHHMKGKVHKQTKLTGEKHKIEVTQHHMKGKVHKQTKLTGEKHKIEVTQHHMKGKVHKQTKLTGEKHKDFIEYNLSFIMKDRGLFHDRMKALNNIV